MDVGEEGKWPVPVKPWRGWNEIVFRRRVGLEFDFFWEEETGVFKE